MKNLTTVLSLVVLCLLLYSRCRQETVAAEGEYPYLVRKNKIESAYDALRWQMFLWYCRGLPQKIDKGAYNLHKKYFEIDTSCVWVGDISQDTFYFDSSKCLDCFSERSKMLSNFPSFVTVEKKTNKLLLNLYDKVNYKIVDTIPHSSIVDSIQFDRMQLMLTQDSTDLPHWLKSAARKHGLLK